MIKLCISIIIFVGFAPKIFAVTLSECAEVCPRDLACWQYVACKTDCSKHPTVSQTLVHIKNKCLSELNQELQKSLLSQSEAKEKKNQAEITRLTNIIDDIRKNLKIIVQ